MRVQTANKHLDVCDTKYADMTPMFDRIKQIVKVKEGK